MHVTISVHDENQHGWPVSLVKWSSGQIVSGFTLASLPSRAARDKYAEDLAAITGYDIEQD